MEKDELYDEVRQMVHFARTETTASHSDGPVRNPAANYTDSEQFELEKERIFRRQPQLVCFGRDIASPGDFRTLDDLGIPILVLRNAAGEVRAFVNACAHRSARLLEGSGNVKNRIVCPYHAWAFDLDGGLAGINKRDTFGSIDESRYSLRSLPCQEKHGLVYVSPDPSIEVDIDAHLGGLARDFASWDLTRVDRVDTGEWHLASNWKLALDTFCEGYHFEPLHPKTVGAASVTNCMTYSQFGANGEHHRLGFPAKSISELVDKPESAWGDVMRHCNFVYYLFPNINLLVSNNSIEFFQLYPGDRVDEHVTRYSLYYREPFATEQARAMAQNHFQMIYDVVDQDDYWVSANVQKNLNSGLISHTTFGRNEPSLINMHRTFRRMAGLPLADSPVNA